MLFFFYVSFFSRGFLALFDSDSRELTGNEGRERRADMQLRSLAGLELGMLVLHGVWCGRAGHPV